MSDEYASKDVKCPKCLVTDNVKYHEDGGIQYWVCIKCGCMGIV